MFYCSRCRNFFSIRTSKSPFVVSQFRLQDSNSRSVNDSQFYDYPNYRENSGSEIRNSCYFSFSLFVFHPCSCLFAVFIYYGTGFFCSQRLCAWLLAVLPFVLFGTVISDFTPSAAMQMYRPRSDFYSNGFSV